MGLDVQLAHALGADLGVRLEFSQVEREGLAESLSSGRIDMVFPNAELVPVDSPRGFFREQLDDVDALVYSAEAGSAWTLVYPDY